MTGKVGSKLAAFEATIAKNNEFGSESCDSSFLTGIASSGNSSVRSGSSSRRRSTNTNGQRHSALPSKTGGIPPEASAVAAAIEDDQNESDLGYTVRWSPRKAPQTSQHTTAHQHSGMIIDAPPFMDDMSNHSSFTDYSSCTEASSASEATVETIETPVRQRKKKGKKVVQRRIRVRKQKEQKSSSCQSSSCSQATAETATATSTTSSYCTGTTPRTAAAADQKNQSSRRRGRVRTCGEQPSSPQKQSSKSSLVDYSSKHQQQQQQQSPQSPSYSGGVDCSPTEASTQHESPSRKSPLDKISATLKRENSGRALVSLAQSAATKIACRKSKQQQQQQQQQISPKKTTSDATFSSEATPEDQPIISRKTYKASPHPKKKVRKQMNDKSVSSLPTMSRSNAATVEASFSSLPLLSNKAKNKKGWSQLLSTSRGSSKQQQATIACSHAAELESPAVLENDPLLLSPTKSSSAGAVVFDNQRPKKQYPRSPMPNKKKLAANKLAAQLIHLDDAAGSGTAPDAAVAVTNDTEDLLDTSPVIVHNACQRTITVATRPAKPLNFNSSTSLFTLDLESNPMACPKSPASSRFVGAHGRSNNVDDASYVESPMSTCSSIKPHHEPAKLVAKTEVVGILRKGTLIRNTVRRVKFADQQPGGGRRMSLDCTTGNKSSKRDAKPMQPRRSSLSDLGSLRQTHSGSAASLQVMSFVAATKLQAVFRGWVQWRSTRLTLLQRKLVRIEQSRMCELARIRDEKWLFMEKVRNEIAEKDKRLESQVALGDKLKDHLKRDTSLVKDQTKKLKDFNHTMKKNNDQLDTSIRLHYENFATMKLAVDLLQEKSASLLKSSNKYAARVDDMNAQLDDTSRSVEAAFQDKRRLKRTIKLMVNALGRRSSDDRLVAKVTKLANGGQGTDDCTRHSSMSEEDTYASRNAPVRHESETYNTQQGFDLKLHGHDNDNMSVFSDLTEFPGQSTSCNDYDPGVGNNNFNNSNHHNQSNSSFGSEESTVVCDIINHSKAKNVRRPIQRNESGDSFAEYSPGKVLHKQPVKLAVAAACSRRDAYGANARRESYRENGAKEIEPIFEAADEDMSVI